MRDTEKSLPLVSIGLPVYNGAAYLSQALNSLLAQDYPNFDLIISDNASTDETQAICQEYAGRDPRIQYHRAECNQGACWNFNRVFKLSDGEFFMWAAHDDLWSSDFIRRCVQALEVRPEAVICHSYGQPMTPDGQPYGPAYVDWVNEERELEYRWRRMMTNWELGAATYGLMRSRAVSQTRMFQVCVSSDFIFIADMIVHGTIIQVPDVLQWKRVPYPSQPYHTHDEMLIYLGGRPRTRLRLLRLGTSLRCLAGLKYAGVPAPQQLRMTLDTLAVYFNSGYWAIDLKECVESSLGYHRYQRWRSFFRARFRQEVR